MVVPPTGLPSGWTKRNLPGNGIWVYISYELLDPDIPITGLMANQMQKPDPLNNGLDSPLIHFSDTKSKFPIYFHKALQL